MFVCREGLEPTQDEVEEQEDEGSVREREREREAVNVSSYMQ